MSRKKKDAVVAIVSSETGVSVEDLNRLPVDALDLLDGLKEDEVVIDGGAIDPEKKLLGYHPITGAEVWM